MPPPPYLFVLMRTMGSTSASIFREILVGGTEDTNSRFTLVKNTIDCKTSYTIHSSFPPARDWKPAGHRNIEAHRLRTVVFS